MKCESNLMQIDNLSDASRQKRCLIHANTLHLATKMLCRRYNLQATLASMLIQTTHHTSSIVMECLAPDAVAFDRHNAAVQHAADQLTTMIKPTLELILSESGLSVMSKDSPKIRDIRKMLNITPVSSVFDSKGQVYPYGAWLIEFLPTCGFTVAVNSILCLTSQTNWLMHHLSKWLQHKAWVSTMKKTGYERFCL